MSSPGQRLESWKGIARYLQRGVRTVRRWEHEEGLPVRRHAHRARASVFALRAELDAWREARSEPARQMPRRTAPVSIAVLAFENLGAAPADDTFAAGLTEEITTTLSRLQALRVTSRTSVLAARGAARTAPALARLLRTRYLLQGSVRRTARRVRISAQLIDGARDAHVWAESFTGRATEVFALQERLARRIVATLRVRLDPLEDERLGTRAIGNAAAYECYLRARAEGLRWQRDSIERAVQLLERALRSADDSPALYAALGIVHLQFREAGIDLSEQPLRRAEACAARLLELEPEAAAALQLRGWICYARGKVQEAVHALKAALALEPHNADALLLLCNCYLISGRVSAARPLLRRLARVDPLTPLSVCMPGFADVMEGRFGRALRPYRQMFELDRANPLARLFYAWVLLLNGRRREARALLLACPPQLKESLPGWMMRQLAAALAGSLEEAPDPLTPEIEAVARATDLYARLLAQAFALADNRTAALRWLQRSIDRGFINYPFLARHDPCLRRLRRDVRFQRLLQQVRLRWRAFEA
jgi:TolB-like protein/thioredoxin-like negative regulator of GroEL